MCHTDPMSGHRHSEVAPAKYADKMTPLTDCFYVVVVGWGCNVGIGRGNIVGASSIGNLLTSNDPLCSPAL